MVLALVLAGPALAQAPSAAAVGKRQFLRCASCHAVDANAPARIGPNLKGIVGRKAASQPGFAYSPALRKQTFVWNEAALDRWLAKPSVVVPGTTMAFAGMPKAQDRKALIEYLRSVR